MDERDDIPEEHLVYCEICEIYYDARDLAQMLPHLKHDPNFPQDYEVPEHYTTRKEGDSTEYLDGKEEVNIN